MRTSLDARDLEALAADVGPQEVRDYLKSRSWTPVTSKRCFAAIFRHTGENAAEVLVPLNRQLGDYAEAMFGAARSIAANEGRSVEAVLRDLRQPRHDVLRFALEGKSAKAGSVSLVEGSSLAAGARKALLASACSVQGRNSIPG